MATESGVSSDVRIWAIRKYKGTRGTTYIVRWRVGAGRHQRTVSTVKLAETFRADLILATRQGVPFRVADGLPANSEPPQAERTWLQHAREYVTVTWPAASPRHRKGIAEALTDITLALLEKDDRFASLELRTALYRYAFNASPHTEPASERLEAATAWVERHSPPLATLNEAIVVRNVLNRLARRQDGSPAAASTVARKRATLHSVLQYAVELELFPSNPLERVQWKAPQPTDAVDRRLVVNPTQARALLSAVRQADPAVAAYFACLYYAGLRPAEARNLRAEDCTLPDAGWGGSCSPAAIRPPAAPGPTRPPPARTAA